MLETLKTLCTLPGVSGCEDEVRNYILERALPFADKVDTDSMGNLIVLKKGRRTPSKKIMLCAHMDEVGIIITGYGEDGYLRFDFVGGVDRRICIGKKVNIGKDALSGVIGIKAYHLVDKDEEKTVPKVSEMYIDIGANSEEAAKAQVSLGDYGCFDSAPVEFGDGFLKARAIDDRVGCAAMLKLLEEELACDCVLAFTVQEEVGARGAAIAAWRTGADIALVLEGTTASDLPDIAQGKRICALGGGLVIPFMDRGTIYSRRLYTLAAGLADKNAVKWQTKTMIAGGTDAQAIQRSGCGVETLAISAPIRNIHSPASLTKISDIQDIPRLTALILEELSKE